MMGERGGTTIAHGHGFGAIPRIFTWYRIPEGFHRILAVDDIRMGFADAAGLNRVSDPPCFHAPYFRKKAKLK